MRLLRLCSITLFCAVLANCASQPKTVTYDGSANSVGDWFPIPSDAPGQFEVTDIEIPRIVPDIVEQAANQPTASLLVEQLIDSLGNASLVFNRNGYATWELVEQALVDLDFQITDKNRDEYRIQLAQNFLKNKSFVDLLGKNADKLKIILIPQGASTSVVVERGDDELPDSEDVASVLEPILEYFQAIQ